MSAKRSRLLVQDWGILDYQESLQRQQQLVDQHLAGQGQDTLILVEHPAVVTLGRRGSEQDLLLPEQQVLSSGVALRRINRGGLATAHEPGQLVAYPVVALKRHDLRWYAGHFLTAVIALLTEYSLSGELKSGEPGVWVNGSKICSFGIAVKKWVCSHGIALNVNNDLRTFELIVPCGRPDERVTSMRRELGQNVNLVEVKEKFVRQFADSFAYEIIDR